MERKKKEKGKQERPQKERKKLPKHENYIILQSKQCYLKSEKNKKILYFIKCKI